MAGEKRVLFAETKGGHLRKITIDSEWVITYGPIAVGVRRDGQESPNVLRIYTDKKRDNLVAVYRDVISVSDERVNVVERKTHTKKKVFGKQGVNGQQTYTAEVRKTVWKDPFSDEPDADESEFDDSVLKIPAEMKAKPEGDDDSEIFG